MQYIKERSRLVGNSLSKYSTDKDAAAKLGYLIERLIYNSIFIIAVLVISFALNVMAPAIAFVIVSMMMRQRFGGLHLKNPIVCLFLSVSLSIFIALMSSSFEPSFVAVIVIYLCTLLVCVLCGVVDTPIKSLSDKRKRSFKMQGVLVLVLIGIFHYNIRSYSVISSAITLTIISFSISLLLGRNLNRFIK